MKITKLRVEPATVHRPWQSKPRKCYDVIASTRRGDKLAARFTSRKRAEAFAEHALDVMIYEYANAKDRYQGRRLLPGSVDTVFGWGTKVAAPIAISYFVDEVISGRFWFPWDVT